MEAGGPSEGKRPSTLAITIAFALIYISWGTTYLAIRVGVEHFPPALFSGTRLGMAGLIMLLFLRATGTSLRVPMREWLWLVIVSILLFVGGNGLVTVGEQTVPSGLTSVLVATTPLWIGVIDLLLPKGDRLGQLGWSGLLVGLLGVCCLLVPRLSQFESLFEDLGPFLVLASAFCWAIGSVIVRARREQMATFLGGAYQLLLGGLLLTIIGTVIGEWRLVDRHDFTPRAIYSFMHLLVFGSLVGFVAYNWLLRHVSASMVGTYAYVNPVVALLAGWLLYQEQVDGWMLAGMAAVLCGVALVRGGSPATCAEKELEPDEDPVRVPEPVEA